MPGGKRESQWQVARRCLTIIRRVQRGPASWRDLVDAVLAQEGPEAYGGAEGEALHRRVANDLQRIRDRLEVELRFDRRAGGYTIRDAWLPLLDLPEDDLATIAFLEQTFDHGSPQHDEVHALLGRLRLYLGVERQAALERCRTALSVDLSRRDEQQISPVVWARLEKARLERRQVELAYLSPRYEDGCPRRHTVDPQDLRFDTAHGHYYLHAYCRCVAGPDGREQPCCYRSYRVDRILDATVLPQKVSPVPPPVPCYAVEYELAPQVARLGVTRHPWMEVEAVERRGDGSALVRGHTDSLFWAVRGLLHYGPTCRVVGGPEMVGEMRGIVEEMGGMYGEA